jgi:alkanesulfonate monooxygenase SsuD/methylene tetrahydromethanopterin reductase-like flavin-dependent oxidoreductase (luciferase family)
LANYTQAAHDLAACAILVVQSLVLDCPISSHSRTLAAANRSMCAGPAAWNAGRREACRSASCTVWPPEAMLAKLAASLDLISGGRLILGLGGGYSDPEITALGSPALSPAEKVRGLAEAIQVIRGAWTQSGYSQDGRHHSVRDLEMEPRPAHPIPVWTGAFGPRALAVTGRLARS